MKRITLCLSPIALLLGLTTAASSQTGGWTFSDDFETGSIDYSVWVRGGRDLSGTGVVDVQSRGSSAAGHVYHSSFTEANLSIIGGLPITSFTTIDFDMEARAEDPGSPGWNFYSMAGAFLYFNGETSQGKIELIDTTSGFRQSFASSTLAVVPVVPSTWVHYSYSMSDIFNLLPGILPTDTFTLGLVINSYCSWWNSSAYGEIWFDNVVVTNLAATLEVAPSPPTGGALATFTAAGFIPGATAYLAYSTLGLGSTPVPPLGLNLDIAGAQRAGSSGTVGVDGKVDWTLLLPPNASGRTVWFQALQQGRSSIPLELIIQ